MINLIETNIEENEKITLEENEINLEEKETKNDSAQMIALMDCYIRAYHFKSTKNRLFTDIYAKKLLKNEEYIAISEKLKEAIEYFNPELIGKDEEAIQWMVEKEIGPSILGRNIFCERHLMNFIKRNCMQYLIISGGYNTFGWRMGLPDFQVYEIEKKEIIEDKKQRWKDVRVGKNRVKFIEKNFLMEEIKESEDEKKEFHYEKWTEELLASGFDPKKNTFANLLGISYYLPKETFKKIIEQLAHIFPEDSGFALDYLAAEETKEWKRNVEKYELAQIPVEERKVQYTAQEMYKLLRENDFLILDILNNELMARQDFFKIYNVMNPKHIINPPKGITHCLVIKKRRTM